MRVLMTTDTVGGVWNYALTLCRSLRPHGVTIRLLTAGRPLSAAQARQADLLPNVTVVESRDRLEWMDDSADDVRRTIDRLHEQEAAFSPDVIHLNGYAYATGEFFAPTLVVGHSCVASWFAAVRGMGLPPAFARYYDDTRRGLLAADHVVAPSAAMLNALRHHYAPLPNAGVIYNGCDGSAFIPRPKQNTILAVGRLWDEAKNIGILRDVAGSVPWPIRVAGDTRGPDGALADTTGLHALGVLRETDLAAELSTAAIFAHPARYEPFGLSVLEAAMSRCALVLGDIPSLREIWDDAAVYVSPDDADALRATLNELVRSPDRRHRLADAAFARAKRYTADAMADAYRAVYEDLIDGRSAAPRNGVLCGS